MGTRTAAPGGARQRAIELERRADLEKQAENWTKSQQLQDYIEAVQSAAARRGISGHTQDVFAAWIRWAKAHAERLDPLAKGFPFETVDDNK